MGRQEGRYPAGDSLLSPISNRNLIYFDAVSDGVSLTSHSLGGVVNNEHCKERSKRQGNMTSRSSWRISGMDAEAV